MSNLVKVDVHGDTLDATVDDAGTPWISIRRVCEVLGIDVATQLEKLKNKHWAVVGLIPMTAADGKTYDTSCISLEALPMWLSHIDPDRVAEGRRPKIILYQKQCARVLAEFFYGPRQSAALIQAPAPSFSMAEFRACIGDMARDVARETVAALVPQLLAAHDSRLATVERQVAANMNSTGVIGAAAGKDICRQITNIVTLRAFEGSGLTVKSERPRLHLMLRRHVNHHGPNAPWSMLPACRLVEALHFLSDAELDASRARKASGVEDKQLTIGNVLKFVKPA